MCICTHAVINGPMCACVSLNALVEVLKLAQMNTTPRTCTAVFKNTVKALVVFLIILSFVTGGGMPHQKCSMPMRTNTAMHHFSSGYCASQYVDSSVQMSVVRFIDDEH